MQESYTQGHWATGTQSRFKRACAKSLRQELSTTKQQKTTDKITTNQVHDKKNG